MIHRQGRARVQVSALLALLAAVALAIPEAAAAVTCGTPAGVTSSSFDPPERDDHTFVLNGAPFMDASCATNEESPLEYDLPVCRYVGPTKPDGTLVDPDSLVQAGLLSATATLTIVFYQEQFDDTPPFVAQRDRLSFNGATVKSLNSRNPAFLQGQADHWRKNSFEIPIGKVRFPTLNPFGGAPAAAKNEIRIDIDTANVRAEQDAWCTSVDWVMLSFKATSPVVLIPGNSQSGAFFTRQGFASGLTSQKLLWDNSIDLSAPTTIADNAHKLDGRIPVIATSFGVDSVHLVAHSKGGLDARAYLADFQRAHDKDFKVLSYTSLSTPHNGSVLANLMVAREDALKQKARVRFEGYPDLIARVAEKVPFNEGYRNLTTDFVGNFSSGNLSMLPGTPFYYAVAADADLNGNGRIDKSPDEFAALRLDSPELQAAYNDGDDGPEHARIAVDTAYQILLKTKGVKVEMTTTRTIFGQKVKVATLVAVPSLVEAGNDTLVTIPSGLGNGSFFVKTRDRMPLTGLLQGRNHSSVANAGVALIVRPWILDAEKDHGDLK